MVNAATSSIKEVDLVVFIINPCDEIGRGDKFILEALKQQKAPVFLVVNKVDENSHEKVAKTLDMYSKEYDFAEIVPISALKGKNVDTLVRLMVEKMPEGPQYYPEDMITDVNERFIVAEIVREKTLKNFYEELEKEQKKNNKQTTVYESKIFMPFRNNVKSF